MDPPPPSTTKLRLMCSYGGHIVTRLHTKSLYYAGGDTRIITIPTTAANLTLSSLTTHLATVLHISNPFTLKYQLPNHDLDSLISLSTDEDLLIMLDEHHRLSPTPSRIRVFLFPVKPISTQPELTQLNPGSNMGELSGNELRHPKTESWFADVLKSAKIMQKGGVGFGGEGQCEGSNGACSVGEVSVGLCGPESMVLETNSSFGSTSSSVSLSNLPAKGQVEDHGAGSLDNKVKLSTSESFASGNSVATAVSHPQTLTYQDPVASVPATENTNSFTPLESVSKILDPSTGVETQKVVHVSGFPLSLQFDKPQVQFVHTPAPHYLPQNPPGMMPISSYYLMSSPVPQQQMYYQTNQPHPIYVVPVGYPYSFPMQSGLINPATVCSDHPPTHPYPSLNPTQVAYKVAAASPAPELASQVYRMVPTSSSLVNVPHNENHKQAEGLPQINLQAQSMGTASIETTNYSNELDDDPARSQIYKSQPPPPTLPSRHQTMTKATRVL
ncbi:hypothetical protein P3X46_029492 [Hevea brasiliensis]|uniref:PB1 domain-containing protein n=1 Tax=Hevea brasiliensis TaxID=3981 RepID=A0ABQ9KVH0_HEVBR|nr:protein PAL OF QUIRKY [Hevea brasiliensis]KAJ9147318.1 hypothetical protein P3X46_029492 [Hevea brasiliensis]